MRRCDGVRKPFAILGGEELDRRLVAADQPRQQRLLGRHDGDEVDVAVGRELLGLVAEVADPDQVVDGLCRGRRAGVLGRLVDPSRPFSFSANHPDGRIEAIAIATSMSNEQRDQRNRPPAHRTTRRAQAGADRGLPFGLGPRQGGATSVSVSTGSVGVGVSVTLALSVAGITTARRAHRRAGDRGPAAHRVA